MSKMQRRDFLKLAGCGVLGAALFPSRGRCADPVPLSEGKGAATQPNILFILCDDLGINDLHCYGRQDHHTPNLDQFATQGLRFTSAYCAQPI